MRASGLRASTAARAMAVAAAGGVLVATLALGAGTAAAATCLLGGEAVSVPQGYVVEGGACVKETVESTAPTPDPDPAPTEGVDPDPTSTTPNVPEIKEPETPEAPEPEAPEVGVPSGSDGPPSTPGNPTGAPGTPAGAQTGPPPADPGTGAPPPGSMAPPPAPGAAPAIVRLPGPDSRGAADPAVLPTGTGPLGAAPVAAGFAGTAAYDPGLLLSSPFGGALRMLAGDPNAMLMTASQVQAMALDLPGGLGAPVVLGVLAVAAVSALLVRRRVLAQQRRSEAAST